MSVPTAPLPNRVLPFIWHVLKSLPLWVRVLLISAYSCTMLVIVADYTMLYAFKMLVDLIPMASASNPWSTLAKPFWIVAAGCVAHGILYRLRGLIDAYDTPQISNNIRRMLLNYMLRHGQDYFHDRFSGSLVSKIGNIVEGYREILLGIILNGIMPAMSAIVFSSLVLWHIDRKIVFTLWIVVAAMLILGKLLGSFVAKNFEKLAETESGVTGQLVDTVSHAPNVKNYVCESWELQLLDKVQAPFTKAFHRCVFTNSWFWGVFDVLATMLLLGFVWQIINGWHFEKLTVGDVTLCVAIGWDIWGRLADMTWHVGRISAETGKIKDALNEILQPHEIVDVPGAAELQVTKGEIEFRDVAFSYKSGHGVFEHLNMHIKPSERVGLVGLSGVGKTTLCQLLLRNYELQGGQILIDNQDIAKVTQASLRESIAVIPQDPSLFHRSLRDNIAYGKPDATEAEIIEAAKAAQAHEFIMATPQKYETLVGERGVKLSGGQRQRIAIARAIIKNAPILLLDEATSALDSQTERSIQAALHTAMTGRTTLVVAHRLSTLAHLDRLVVMKDGKIVEDGTLSELLTLGGHFAELWRLQADGFLPDGEAGEKE